MHPLIRIMRLLTHVNIGTTIALLAWLATAVHAHEPSLLGKHRASSAMTTEGGVQ
ncbi:MAG: hypothetical protein PHV80_09485 [Rugosibacter sp.]|nr:hypothetical protein [Rugosibacter sp.]